VFTCRRSEMMPPAGDTAGGAATMLALRQRSVAAVREPSWSSSLYPCHRGAPLARFVDMNFRLRITALEAELPQADWEF